jgi:acetylornithine deacetylase/succinyl-diaminopimelate desuccinylase-like protein
MEITCYKPTTGGATETPSGHPVVHAAQAACRHHHGRDLAVGGFQGGCELVHFRRLGAHGVVLGPGDLAVAHKPDEFVPEGELVLATHIYRDIAIGLLGH